MPRLISSVEKLKAIFGFHAIDDLLAPGIHLDGPKTVTPVAIEWGDGWKLVSREQETGNLAAVGVRTEQTTFYDRYFTVDRLLDKTAPPVHPDFASAVAALTDNSEVVVEPDIPYARYHQLKSRLPVKVDGSAGGASAAGVWAFRVSVRTVLQRFEIPRTDGEEAALRIIAERPHLASLAERVRHRQDTRFSSLDAMVAARGAGAILFLAPINVQEVLGVAAQGPVAAVRVPGEDFVWVLSAEQSPAIEGSPAGRYGSLVEAMKAICPGEALAIEEGYLDMGKALALEAAGFQLLPSAAQISLWREQRAHEDLPYYIIAAQATRYSMEKALEITERSLAQNQPITEKEVYRHYLHFHQEFRKEYGLNLPILPFFINCHAGNRTVYPSRPTDFALNAQTKSLKLDAGVKITYQGVILGTSDLGRTLVVPPDGRQGYETFQKILREELIPGIRVGETCEHVHQRCIDRMLHHRDALMSSGLLPAELNLRQEYVRNVGHLMGKQESFKTELRPGDKYALHEGAVGAVEIQWPYNGYGITAEELWILTAEGAVTISV